MELINSNGVPFVFCFLCYVVCGDTYIGPTPTIPDSDDYGDIASSLGVYGSMTSKLVTNKFSIMI